MVCLSTNFTVEIHPVYTLLLTCLILFAFDPFSANPEGQPNQLRGFDVFCIINWFIKGIGDVGED